MLVFGFSTIIYNYKIIFTAKLLVTTGTFMDTYDNGLHSEVIDIDNEFMICDELASAAYPMKGGAGGLVKGKPIICGGFYEDPLNGGFNKCFILGENQSKIMEHQRAYPAGISISKDKVSNFSTF